MLWLNIDAYSCQLTPPSQGTLCLGVDLERADWSSHKGWPQCSEQRERLHCGLSYGVYCLLVTATLISVRPLIHGHWRTFAIQCLQKCAAATRGRRRSPSANALFVRTINRVARPSFAVLCSGGVGRGKAVSVILATQRLEVGPILTDVSRLSLFIMILLWTIVDSVTNATSMCLCVVSVSVLKLWRFDYSVTHIDISRFPAVRARVLAGSVGLPVNADPAIDS